MASSLGDVFGESSFRRGRDEIVRSFAHVARLTDHQAPVTVCNFVTDRAIRRWANRHAIATKDHATQ
jgi:adenylylsulfate kinase-like enzyme